MTPSPRTKTLIMPRWEKMCHQLGRVQKGSKHWYLHLWMATTYVSLEWWSGFWGHAITKKDKRNPEQKRMRENFQDSHRQTLVLYKVEKKFMSK